MTQGELEGIPVEIEKAFSELEIRILSDIVRRIKINGFSTASADWQITRLQQLGRSEEDIKEWIQDALEVSDQELERIFSNTVYEEYYGHERAYKAYGMKQMPLDNNEEMHKLIQAVKIQTAATFRNMTASMGFALQDPSGRIDYTELREFYQKTLDAAIMDIQSGAFSYQEVLERTINTMTKSGIRWVDYESGHHNRIDVAARRAVMTGFRQVQEKINEQVAADLGTDAFEVTYHVGARPTHQPWQGRVWTMEQLINVCGLGTVTGLHGVNCYHDYNAFIPGVSARTYTDEQLDQMIAEENRKKEYNGKEYTTYEALQQQRRMETAMRKTRRDIQLMQEGESDDDALTLKKAKYQGQMQTYRDFSKEIGLPEQLDRVYQGGLSKKTVGKSVEKDNVSGIIKEIKIPMVAKEVLGITDDVYAAMQRGIDIVDAEYKLKLSSVLVEDLSKNHPNTPYLCRYIDVGGKHAAEFVINSGFDFSDIDYIVTEGYAQKYFAGKTLEDHIIHEMAHVMTGQECDTAQEFYRLLKELEPQFVAGVSGYSDVQKDGFETIAEAFVRMRNKEDVPEEAKKLVEKYVERWKR